MPSSKNGATQGMGAHIRTLPPIRKAFDVTLYSDKLVSVPLLLGFVDINPA
ncbi:hypothetical protein QLS71_009980 [Mariniflexile litorale]|uniref:Uncharacterized protein n=1 Tax=Mariniflexile litorale TaxID=3045158 RepID=A0AAU7EC96_9FLAO|nr:hypothetical protein [Mariniflexile sp. KMM 9835]MDQ8210456.1 hypothetical protein [Mariniflexile sp. KMM 9835]